MSRRLHAGVLVLLAATTWSVLAQAPSPAIRQYPERGYGLMDSAKVRGRPGDTKLELKVASAASPQDAAKVYPGDYWLSLLKVPEAGSFPGTGNRDTGGNG